MGDIEKLAQIYHAHIALPWQTGIAGAQRVVMVVYDKNRERALRARLREFENATRSAGHGWHAVDISDCFGGWMAGEEYRAEYFAAPEDLRMKLESEFTRFVAARVIETIDASEATAVVAILGAGALYGLTRVSRVVKLIEEHIRGRLLVFFPGTLDRNNYRLLDARDGWNYLAVPVTLHQGGANLC